MMIEQTGSERKKKDGGGKKDGGDGGGKKDGGGGGNKRMIDLPSLAPEDELLERDRENTLPRVDVGLLEAVGLLEVGGILSVAYVALKIIETPLLLTPQTMPLYFIH